MGSTARKRILVVGGGFGGIATVRALHKALHGRSDIAIALVNQENYAVFQPMLAEVISGNMGFQALLKVNLRLAATDYLSNAYDGL